jgi:precorrin-3B C17-methyltransferase
MTGSLTVVGLGPGRVDWCPPGVVDRIAAATDLVGYRTYLDMVAIETDAPRHPSDNRVEADRAAFALDLAEAGGTVVLVSSGDPGVFAMASAVIEQLDRQPDRWVNVPVEVLPGITAAQAVASRVGAPLGHDFCVISLSDVLKPWAVIERRLDAAAGADFVLALYNPTSRHRPWQLGRAIEVIELHRDPSTPVVLGRDVGRPDEQIDVISLAGLGPAATAGAVDMRTVLVIGSSTTRVLPGRPLGSRVYTPRWYGPEADQPSATLPSHATA